MRNRKENRNLSNMLKTYFGSRFSPELEGEVKSWLLDNKDSEELNSELETIWDSLPSKFDSECEQSLVSVNEKIGVVRKVLSGNLSLGAKLMRFAAVLAPLLVLIGVYWWKTSQPVVVEDEGSNAMTTTSGHKQFTLADGSSLWLNSGSSIEVIGDMESGERAVKLKGESQFEVEADETRAFLVHADCLIVKATGTRFNVEAYDSDDRLVVTLSHGKVNVSLGDNDEYELEPYQQLTYSKVDSSISLVHLSKAGLEEVFSWNKGDLVFKSASVSKILSTIERRFEMKVKIEGADDVKSADRLFDGSYSVKFVDNENVEEVLEVLSFMISGFNYEIDRGGENIIIRKE